MTPNELSDRLWHFAARVAKVVDALPDTRTGRHVAGQLIRCGTSAPPNYEEGRVAESRSDFAHKINIALKELVETEGLAEIHRDRGPVVQETTQPCPGRVQPIVQNSQLVGSDFQRTKASRTRQMNDE